MSTHAVIIMQTQDGYKSIYLHGDGYPSYALTKLKKHYVDREKVESMIALGDMSSLGESIECPTGHHFDSPAAGHSVFYGRDRGETHVDSEFHVELKDHLNYEHCYLYTLDSQWEEAEEVMEGYKAGDEVEILNQTLSGKVIIEGTAILIKRFDRNPDNVKYPTWRVRFVNDDYNEEVNRTLYPQSDIDNVS